MGGRNDVANRSVGWIVVGGYISWEKMSGSEITAVRRTGFCPWRKESAISILLILTPRQYSCSVSDSFRLKKDCSIGTNVSGCWRAACRQRPRRGFFVSQEELTQPRASSVFWSALASNGRGESSDSVTVWWMGRGQHKGRAMLEQRLWVVFGDLRVVVE